MLLIAVSAQQLEVDLAAVGLSARTVVGRWRDWGLARPRVVRMRDGARSLRAAAGVLSWVWSYACAVSVVGGPVSARRGGGDRRGAAFGGWWRGPSPDRPAGGPSAGDGPRGGCAPPQPTRTACGRARQW
jgi:hypothetical protein